MENKMTRDELLCSVCNKNEYRENLRNPFIQGGWTVATDAHVILAVSEEESDFIGYSYIDKPDVLSLINAKCSDFKELVYDDLLIEYLNLEGGFDYAACRCTECNGGCQVDYEYRTKRGNIYHTKGECPVCHGEGIVDLDYEYSKKEHCLEIEPDFGLSIPRIKIILDTMRFFGKSRCMMLKDNRDYGTCYHIREKEFRLVVMPIIIQ